MVDFDNKTYAAWLASAEIPYDSLIPLLHQMKSAEEIYRSFSDPGGPARRLIPKSYLQRLSAAANTENLNRLHASLLQYDIRVMTIFEEMYPHCLRTIPDPPGILFYQGNPDCLKREKKAAMVGSRAASYAGLKAANKIAAELSRNGVMVISGLAFGIDSESHRGCMEGGSPTIAVMGCGLDRTYPARNDSLKKDILDSGGLVLSEYAPGTTPYGFHFPYRNRIISGLSSVVILMEARIRSGSMTTVGHALAQGREVYAYPGDPVSPLYEGNRLLLREGAHYFSEAGDILADMNWLDKITHVGHNNVCSSKAVPANDAERGIFKALEKGDLGFDELLSATGLSSSELMSTLTILQIKKMINPLPGKRYQLRNE